MTFFGRTFLFHTNKWKGFEFQWLKGSQILVIRIQGNFIHGSKKTSWGLQNLYYFQATRNSLVESWIMENIFLYDQCTLGCFPAVRQSLKLKCSPKFSKVLLGLEPKFTYNRIWLCKKSHTKYSNICHLAKKLKWFMTLSRIVNASNGWF